MFHLSLLLKDAGVTVQREVSVALEPPAQYSLVQEENREL